MMDFKKIAARVSQESIRVSADMKVDTMTVGQLKAAMAGLPDDAPVLMEEFTGWVTTLPGVTPRQSVLNGQKVLLVPTSDRGEAVNADETGGPTDMPDAGVEEDDPGPPSDPGSPYDTLEEKKGLK